jgi:hypothetical protein
MLQSRLPKALACWLLTGLVFLAWAPNLRATDEPVTIEAEGEASLGDYDTPKEVMERAKRQALTKATEKAVGIFIKSHTLVSNFQLADDLIYASVRGRAKDPVIVKEAWDERGRTYRVLMRTTVEPIYPEKGGGVALKLTMSKTVLKEGEEARVFYQANRDCYVYLFSVAADGSVTVLLPNSLHRDNLARANRAYAFPPPDSGIKLQARLVPGHVGDRAEERIKIIGTRQKEDLLPLGFQEAFFKVYDGRSTGMVSDLIRTLNRLEPADWGEAGLVYTISR